MAGRSEWRVGWYLLRHRCVFKSSNWCTFYCLLWRICAEIINLACFLQKSARKCECFSRLTKGIWFKYQLWPWVEESPMRTSSIKRMQKAWKGVSFDWVKVLEAVNRNKGKCQEMTARWRGKCWSRQRFLRRQLERQDFWVVPEIVQLEQEVQKGDIWRHQWEDTVRWRRGIGVARKAFVSN